MSEQSYYEFEEFWKEGMVSDEANTNRLTISAALVPPGIQTLADIGCGNGIFAQLLQQLRPEIDVTCVDRSEAALQFVKHKRQLGEITDLPFADNTFDCVTCLEVLEHIPYPAYNGALEELVRVTKSSIIISVPYRENTEVDITKCPACYTVFNAELHVRNYFEKDVQELFTKFGFRCVQQRLIEKKNKTYAGINWYINFRNYHLRNKGKFRAPSCPVCGYVNKSFSLTAQAAGAAQNGPVSGGGIKEWVKNLWPVVYKKVYWTAAVYERL